LNLQHHTDLTDVDDAKTLESHLLQFQPPSLLLTSLLNYHVNALFVSNIEWEKKNIVSELNKEKFI